MLRAGGVPFYHARGQFRPRERRKRIANKDKTGRTTGLSSNQKQGASALSPLHEGRLRIGYFLRKLNQKNQSLWQAQCPDPMLTSVQAGALSVLHFRGPTSLSELALEAAIDQSTVRGVVDRLSKRELVTCETDEADGRRVIVKLLPAGERLAVELQPMMRQIASDTLEPLNPAERLAFEFLIEKLIPEDNT